MSEYRQVSDAEEMLVHETLAEFSQLQTDRNIFAAHWEEVAELIMPTSRNTFMFGSYNTPGEKKTQRQIDASGMMALHRFGAICDSLLTPQNQSWHGLRADDDYVMKDRATRLWFEATTRKLRKYRYAPHANFASQNQQIYQSLGAFGTGPMFIDAFHGGAGMRYRALPLGEWFMYENHQGMVIGGIRWFRLRAHQIASLFGREAMTDAMQKALEKKSQVPFNFLHRIYPRGKDYDPGRLDAKGKKWGSCYVSLEGRCLMRPEGGYRSFPVVSTRYDQTPGEVYGRSPAMMVLPALKTLNAQKRVFLKAGHRAADPVLLSADDGMNSFNLRPGALNPGTMSADGKRLVDVLPAGNIQISKEMMQDEKALINDAFMVSLFQILTETPQMSATEVIERTSEKGILLAPTIGRQGSEYLGPMIERELDVLADQGLLDPMPPRLREAGGSYSVVYTSPLARAARAQEAAGFMRTIETVKELVNITQDASLLDPFDFDMAVPAIAEIQSVPESWMADKDKIAGKRKARAQAQQTQQQIQAMPAQAAMMKAQAVQAKAGMGQRQPEQQAA